MKFTEIPQSAFADMQMNAGVLLSQFDPTGAVPMENEHIITATTGGINISCVPTFTDMGEDVDNCPNNMLEMKKLEGWEARLSCTALSATPESIRMSLGAADISITETGKVTPRMDVKMTDYQSVWWVGDRGDGGFVAVEILNALSTGGFGLQTSKNGKGQLSIELTGHVSIHAQNVVPMVFWAVEGTITEGSNETV